MYKKISMLNDIAMEAKHHKEVMLLMTNEGTIDFFIKHYGGKRCTDDDGRKFIDYNGCKIYYSILNDKEHELDGARPRISRSEILRELELHQNALEHFKNMGVRVSDW